jgi:hypothetical protein
MLQKTTLLLLVSTAGCIGATALASAQANSAAEVDKFHNFTPPVKAEDQGVRAQATANEEARGTRSERRRGREARTTRMRGEASAEVRASNRTRSSAQVRGASAEQKPAAAPSTVGVDTFHSFTPPVKTEETTGSVRTNATAELRGTRSERRRGREAVRTRDGENLRAAVGTPSPGTTSGGSAYAPSPGYNTYSSNNYSYSNGSWNSGGSWNDDWGSSPRYYPGYAAGYSSWDNGYANRCYTMGRVLIDGVWQTRRVWICG